MLSLFPALRYLSGPCPGIPPSWGSSLPSRTFLGSLFRLQYFVSLLWVGLLEALIAITAYWTPTGLRVWHTPGMSKSYYLPWVGNGKGEIPWLSWENPPIGFGLEFPLFLPSTSRSTGWSPLAYKLQIPCLQSLVTVDWGEGSTLCVFQCGASGTFADALWECGWDTATESWSRCICDLCAEKKELLPQGPQTLQTLEGSLLGCFLGGSPTDITG